MAVYILWSVFCVNLRVMWSIEIVGKGIGWCDSAQMKFGFLLLFEFFSSFYFYFPIESFIWIIFLHLLAQCLWKRIPTWKKRRVQFQGLVEFNLPRIKIWFRILISKCINCDNPSENNDITVGKINLLGITGKLILEK